MSRLLSRPLWLQAAALGLALAIMGGLSAYWSSDLAHWDERLASKTWALSDASATERRVVVVDIDEKSVQALGPWPWPRERVATLINALRGYGTQLQVVDILFEGPQPQDPLLAAALAKQPAVIGQLFAIDANANANANASTAAQGIHSGIPAGALALPGGCPRQFTAAAGHMAPPPALAGSGALVGHITPAVDPDGAVRRVPALLCYEGRAYPSLVVAALAAGTGAPVTLQTTQTGAGASHSLDIGGIQLPVDAQGHVRVSYQMPRAGFVSVSAADVLQGRAPADLLKGAWVLVGSTAMGAGDSIPTPQASIAGGVEVHAQLLSAALDGRTPYVPAWAPYWPWATGAVTAALLLLALRLGGNRAGIVMPLAALGIIGGLFAAHAVLLLQAHQWLGWGRPAVFVVLSATLLTGAEQLRLRFERERLFQNFTSYLPGGAARRVALAAPTAEVVAESRAATVMFVDLRNFSAYCDNHTPQSAASVLHRFYTTVEGIVTAHGGEVEQMVGDGIMAVWNGSEPCPDHAARAIVAAPLIWRAALEQLPLQATRRSPPLDIGVGLESGDALVGSFGPAQRRVHTVMGEPVNVAMRLQGLTSELGYPILVGPQAARQYSGAPKYASPSSLKPSAPSIKKLGDFLLEGLQQPRTVHCLPVEVGAGHLRLASRVDMDGASATG